MDDRANEVRELSELRKISSKWTEYRNVLVLSIGFFLVYTSFFAIQNLQSSLNQAGGLGVISLVCFYGVFVLSGFIAPLMLKICGTKWTIVIGFIVHVIYAASNIHTLWPTLIAASCILGFISGPLWTAQGIYVSERARRYADITSESLQTVISRFNGIFFGIIMSAQISGNLLSSLIIYSGPGDTGGDYKNDPSINDTITSTICGRNDCPGTVSEANASLYNSISKPPAHIVYTLFGVFTALDVAGVALTEFILQKIQKEDMGVSIKTTISSCVNLNLTDCKMLALVPLLVSQAMVVTILWADYTKSYVSCSIGIGMVGYVMTANGAVSCLVSIILGRLAKYTGRVAQIMFVEVVYLSLLVAIYLWSPTKNDYYVLFVVAAVWGVGEPVLLTQGIALLVSVFKDKQEAAIAILHTWRSVGFALSFALSNYLCVSTKIIIVGSIHILGMICYACVEIVIWCRIKRDLHENNNVSRSGIDLNVIADS